MSVTVVGRTGFSLDLAASLATRGEDVRLIRLSDGISGGPAFGDGVRRALSPDALTTAWGEVRRVDSLTRGLWWRGRLSALPLEPTVLMDAVGRRGFARVVAERLGSRLIRDGLDLQTHVRKALGPTLYDELYAPWATKRFGADPKGLAAELAQLPTGNCYAPALSAARLAAGQTDRVWDNDGEVVDGVELQGFEWEDDRLIAIVTDVGRVLIDGTVYTDVGLPLWFGGPIGEARHAVQVTLSAKAGHLPWSTMVADAEKPFWRLTRPELLPGEAAAAGLLTAHLTLRSSDPLWAATDAGLGAAVKAGLDGIAEVQRGAVIVQRWRRGVPLPAPGSLPNRLAAVESAKVRGIVGFGPIPFGRPDDGRDWASDRQETTLPTPESPL